MTYKVNLYCQFLFVQIMQITAMPENAIVHLSTSDTVQIIQITAIPENFMIWKFLRMIVQIIQITAMPENLSSSSAVGIAFK